MPQAKEWDLEGELATAQDGLPGRGSKWLGRDDKIVPPQGGGPKPKPKP